MLPELEEDPDIAEEFRKDMTVMTAGTGGFGGDAAATGPNAGYDPVMKFRGKIKKKDAKKLVAPGNKLGESRKILKHHPDFFSIKLLSLKLVRL